MQYQSPHLPISLLSTALARSNLLAISEMLESLVKATNAYGCILWQVVPGANLDEPIPTGQLFVVAEWFPGNKSNPLHDMPIDGSITGKAISSNTLINVPDRKANESVFKDPFLEDAGIHNFCSVPIRFRGGTRGAINLYRTEATPFNDEEIERIRELASLVPNIYKDIRDKVSFSVIRKINRILQKAEIESSSAPLTKDKVSRVIQLICTLVSNTFKCVETSIFLEDRVESPGIYKLIATTWPEGTKEMKLAYTKSKKDGITGWILKMGKPVTIFDLAHYHIEEKNIVRRYPGMKWTDPLNIKGATRRARHLAETDPLPPLSFMAAPIIMGKEIYGVIRCSVAQKGPYYFADLALSLLQLVAAQISRYWSNWLSQREKQEQIKSWERLVKSVSELNKFVHEELSKEAPNENLILKKALDITSAVIKGAEIIDVRLLDEKSNELYFAETAGQYWSEGKQEEVRRRRLRRFPLDDKSAGAKVFREGIVHVMPNVKKDPDYSGTFNGIKRMIIAPIQVADKKFGVLDLRGIGESDFPRHAEPIAGLLGQQLGLYYYLATIIRELRNTKDDLNKHANEEIQTFQDLTHQLKTPITSALRWLEQTLYYAKGNENLEKRLWAIRGLCGKALRVSSNTRLFADLAQGKGLSLNVRELKLEDLLKLLKEANQDIRHLVPERRNISFYVEEDSFKEAYRDSQNKQHFYLKGLELDVNLLEQALGDILENAAKYSWSGTKVRVFGGWTGGGRFHISVENYGLEIKTSEVNLCKRRGWQSEKAQDRSGQGTGIGLWIVDNIMTSHGGELEIKATTSYELTQVRLIFPLTRVIR